MKEEFINAGAHFIKLAAGIFWGIATANSGSGSH
jgi:hypothetical protein